MIKDDWHNKFINIYRTTYSNLRTLIIHLFSETPVTQIQHSYTPNHKSDWKYTIVILAIKMSVKKALYQMYSWWGGFQWRSFPAGWWRGGYSRPAWSPPWSGGGECVHRVHSSWSPSSSGGCDSGRVGGGSGRARPDPGDMLQLPTDTGHQHIVQTYCTSTFIHNDFILQIAKIGKFIV